MISRCILLLAFGLATLSGVAPSWAQSAKPWHIGFLYYGSRQSVMKTGRYAAFVDGMRDLGYVEGRDYVIDARFSEGNVERLPALAAELAKLKPEVILVTSNVAADAARRVARGVPIVTTIIGDPIASGAATTLARPGGDITGLYTSNDELVPKHLELLQLAVPKLMRVAVLSNSSNALHPARLRSAQAYAQKAGLKILPVSAVNEEEIARAFESMVRLKADGVLILGDTFFVQEAPLMAKLALKWRLPSIFGTTDFIEVGGLMSYSENLTDNFRLAAGYVDKILKGAKPGELPFERPSRVYLMINLRTATTLGLKLPQELLLRADKVIE